MFSSNLLFFYVTIQTISSPLLGGLYIIFILHNKQPDITYQHTVTSPDSHTVSFTYS